MFALTSRSFFHEWRRSRRGNRPRFSLQLMLFEEGFTVDIFGLFVPLLFLDRWRREPREMMESWGFTACDRTVHFNWGDSCKVVYMPWMYTLVSHEVQRTDGSWTPYVGSYERDKVPDGRALFAFDYTYTLRNGEVQHRTAEVYAERWDRRWRMLKWTSLFRDVSHSINYTFSDEVGERTGSWKGGCISSGETMKAGETVEEAFRRMERERKF